MRDDSRTERVLHETFYQEMQHAVQDSESAIRDAREFIYATMAHLAEPDSVRRGGLEIMAENWLETNGRDQRKEAQRDYGGGS